MCAFSLLLLLLNILIPCKILIWFDFSIFYYWHSFIRNGNNKISFICYSFQLYAVYSCWKWNKENSMCFFFFGLAVVNFVNIETVYNSNNEKIWLLIWFNPSSTIIIVTNSTINQSNKAFCVWTQYKYNCYYLNNICVKDAFNWIESAFVPIWQCHRAYLTKKKNFFSFPTKMNWWRSCHAAAYISMI